MKKCVMIALLAAGLLVPVFGQLKADYQMKIEYTAEQVNLPYENFYAAYLVNTTTATVVIAARYDSVISFMGLIGKTGEDGGAEVLLSKEDFEKAKDGLDFKPGEKLLLYCPGFSPEYRAKYPYSELSIRVFVNGKEKKVWCIL